MNLLLLSLPQSWDPFTTSYLRSQMGEKILKLQEFIVIIHDEYNQQKSAGGSIKMVTMEATLASSSKHTSQKRKAVKSEKKKACHTCGRDNHLSKDCFFKGKPKCTNCGRFNHEASDCRSAEKGKGKSMDSMTTQNGKCQKTEHVQQACNIQEDEEMEDGMYVANNKQLTNHADITIDSWLVDSAMSLHLLNLHDAFLNFTPLKKTIRGVGDTDVPVKGRGTIKLTSQTNEETFAIILKDVLYVPQALNNLFSISHLNESDGHTVMGTGCIQLYEKNKFLIAIGRKVERMYLLHVTVQPAAEHLILSKEGESSWQQWHHQFGHIGVSSLQQTLDGQMVTGMVVNKGDSPKFDCEACIQAKQAHAPFPCQSESRTERPSDLTHTDLWECHTMEIHSARYFISFIDDHS